MNIASHDAGRVAFKVRFLGASVGEELRNFNVYLDQKQNWRTSISQQEEGGSVLRVAEGMCIVDEDLGVIEAGDTLTIPARVGMIEVYGFGPYDVGIPSFEKAQNCEEIANRWLAGEEWDIDPPTADAPIVRQLIGELYLVNVESGLAATYSQIALSGFSETLSHTAPGSDSPNLADADPLAVIDGVSTEPLSGEGIDAVAMVIAENRDTLMNDVITAQGINATTDWIISYPLSPYKNYRPYEAIIDGEVRQCEAFGGVGDEAGDNTVEVGVDKLNGTRVWGSGEFSGHIDCCISPAPRDVVDLGLCRAINVVPFGANTSMIVESDSPLLSKQPAPMKPDPFQGASATVWWRPHPSEFPQESGVLRPVVAFRLTTFQNGNLNGGSTLANYAVIRQHQRIRR